MSFEWKYQNKDIDNMAEIFIKKSVKRMNLLLDDGPLIDLLKEDIDEYLYISSLFNFLAVINNNKDIYYINLKKIDNYINKLNSNKQIYNKICEYKKAKGHDLLFLQKVIQGYEKVGIKIDGRLNDIIRVESALNVVIPYEENITVNRKKKEEEYYNKFKKYTSSLLNNIILKNKWAVSHKEGCYSDYVNKYNLAKNSENINKFLYNLLYCIKEKYNDEHTALLDLNKGTAINSWDLEFLLKKYRDSEELGIDVSKYFSHETCIPQVFEVFENIFNIIIIKVQDVEPLWGKNVQKYVIKVQDNIIGTFYLDLLNNYNLNKCFLIPNFDKIVGILIKSGKTQFFKVNDLVSFFHDFTHIIQYILSSNNIKHNLLNVVNNEIDLIKTPCFIMEYIFWTPGIIKKLSSHYKTQAKLTDDNINQIIKMRDLTLGFEFKKHITLAFYDQVIYSSDELLKICTKKDVNETLFYNVFQKINKLISPEINIPSYVLYPGTPINYMFGSNAIYYNYLWNKVYAAELFYKTKSLDDLKATLQKLILNPDKKSIVDLEGFINIHNITVDNSTEYSNYYTEA